MREADTFRWLIGPLTLLLPSASLALFEGGAESCIDARPAFADLHNLRGPPTAALGVSIKPEGC